MTAGAALARRVGSRVAWALRATSFAACLTLAAVATCFADQASPTFADAIGPLLWKRCAECHRPGEVAPFALLDYEDAAKRADQIADLVEARVMPPWKAARGFGDFVDERRLSDEEVAQIVAWARAGAPAGDLSALPPPPQFSTGWRLGEPDLVLELPESFEISADAGNVYRWFPLETNLNRDEMIAAYEFQAGNPRVVHHAIMFLDTSNAARILDARDPGPGYGNFGGPGFLPVGFVGSWSSGATPRPLPEGLGIPLRKGAVVALQMHYATTGKVEHDRSRVGLYFRKQPGARHVSSVPVMNIDFEIPADARAHRVEGSLTLPVAVDAIGIVPHMHYLGREMRVWAQPPGKGPIIPLVWVNDWDFNWQDHYRLKEPIRLPKGTELKVEAIYDNTSGNPKNPHSPPTTVRYGSHATDEMCLAGIQVSLLRPVDFATIAVELVKRYLKANEGKLLINPFE